MKFIEVKELPNVRRYNPLDAYFKEFMAMNIKIAKIDFEGNGYKTVRTAQTTLYNSAKNRGYPISVVIRNGELYLIRRDM